MKRRDTFKTLLIGSVAGGALLHTACKEDAKTDAPEVKPEEQIAGAGGEGYGRTPEEAARDQRLASEQFFNEHELATIAVLCDIILPAEGEAGSATDAEVPAFIEFIAKDLPYHQLPLRGGLAWLDGHANRRFGKRFIDLENGQQTAIIDDVAYPDNIAPGMEAGGRFFSKMRDLTLTGYYTTRTGLDDLGYKGNTPNVWDGVPTEVLKDHDVELDAEWAAKCIDQSKRAEVAEWDEAGNLLT